MSRNSTYDRHYTIIEYVLQIILIAFEILSILVYVLFLHHLFVKIFIYFKPTVQSALSCSNGLTFLRLKWN